MSYCCKMREKYLIGIVSEDTKLPTPVDAVDFTDFDARSADGRPVLRAKFCPFCGKAIDGPLRVGGTEPPPGAEPFGVVRILPEQVGLVLEQGGPRLLHKILAQTLHGWGELVLHRIFVEHQRRGLEIPTAYFLRIRPATPEDIARADAQGGGGGT